MSITNTFDKTSLIISLFIDSNFFILAVIVLFAKMRIRPESRILFLGLFVIIIAKVAYEIFYSAYIYYVPHLMRIYIPLIFLIPPLPYFYFKVSLIPDYEFRKKDLLHLLPSFCTAVWFIPFFILPASEKVNWLNSHLQENDNWFSALVFILFFIYYFLILRKYLEVKKVFHEVVLNKNSLQWLKQFLLILLLIVMGELGLFLMTFTYNSLRYTSIIIYPFFYVLIIKIIINPKVFFERTEEITKTKRNNNNSIKSLNTKLIVEKIDKSLEDRAIFTSRDMSLSVYAMHLNIPEHHLSIVLNQVYKLSFNDFINNIRIEEAVKLLANEDFNHYSIDGISKMLGYGSRTTFIYAFKKNIGINPSEFRKVRK